MKYEIDDCCDCAVPGYPCLGSSCSRRHTLRYKCDECGDMDLSEEEISHVDGMDLCNVCYDERFPEDEE